MTSLIVMSWRMEYSWVTTESLRLTAAALRLSTWPSTRISPSVGSRTVDIIEMVVVLPAPFGPSKPMNSFVSMVRFRWSTAVKSPKRFVRFLISIMAFSRRIGSCPCAIRPLYACSFTMTIEK